MTEYEARFNGVARLYGKAGLQRLEQAHVCVIGLGGVGSWAVEALARSGIGRLTLIDLDEICVTNVNRQLHALAGHVGRPKVEVMAERVRGINPQCAVQPIMEFFTESNAAALVALRPSAVLDAIDSVANKCRLIALCHKNGIPIVTCGGAGGRRLATAVRVSDLAQTTHDRLLQRVREGLRKEHGFPPGQKPFGIDAVHSAEPPVFPQSDGSVCARREEGSTLRLDCESGYGTASFVTGTFGFVAAGCLVGKLAVGQASNLSRELQPE